jgi:hypothetical protein
MCPGTWLLGNARSLLDDTAGTLTAGYERCGPVFRIRAAWRQYTILAAPEAADVMAQGLDKAHLSRERLFGPRGELVRERRADGPGEGPPMLVDALATVRDPSGASLTEDEGVGYAAYGIGASIGYVGRLAAFMASRRWPRDARASTDSWPRVVAHAGS